MEPDKIRKKLRALLDKERFDHSISVEITALELAKIHGVDPYKTAVAGLLHDCAKNTSPDNILKAALKEKIKMDLFLKKEPKLVHGLLSASIARKDFGISDPDILAAISNHTSGRPGMSDLEKIIFLADHLEPGREGSGRARMFSVAKKDLDKAIVMVADDMIKYLIKRGFPIHSRAILTRNYYIKKTNA